MCRSFATPIDGRRGPERMVRLRVLVGLGLALAAALVPAGSEQPLCRSVLHAGGTYRVCQIDLEQYQARLVWRGPDGLPFAAFWRLPDALDDRPVLLAMNAGMFRPDLSPAGLYIEGGVRYRRLNTADGPGNFHLKPNAVLLLGPDGARVMETGDYASATPPAEYATQSGPMLVIDGELHPALLADSRSRHQRNGACAPDPQTLVLAITEQPVTLHAFARLFRDALGCDAALYLDGAVSSLFDPAIGRRDFHGLLGPMIVVLGQPEPP